MSALRILGATIALSSLVPECRSKKAAPDPTATVTPPPAPSDSGPQLSQLYPPSAAKWDKLQDAPPPPGPARDGGARDGGKGRRDAGGSDYERALELSETDTDGARSILEPKVMTGKGTPDEVRLMHQLCKAQSDQACLETLKKKYPNVKR